MPSLSCLEAKDDKKQVGPMSDHTELERRVTDCDLPLREAEIRTLLLAFGTNLGVLRSTREAYTL